MEEAPPSPNDFQLSSRVVIPLCSSRTTSLIITPFLSISCRGKNFEYMNALRCKHNSRLAVAVGRARELMASGLTPNKAIQSSNINDAGET